jgi:hypothetical protein
VVAPGLIQSPMAGAVFDAAALERMVHRKSDTFAP